MNCFAEHSIYASGLRSLALRDIASFGRNVIYAGNVRRNFGINVKEKEIKRRSK